MGTAFSNLFLVGLCEKMTSAGYKKERKKNKAIQREEPIVYSISHRVVDITYKFKKAFL